jgi:hypothetical protein
MAVEPHQYGIDTHLDTTGHSRLHVGVHLHAQVDAVVVAQLRQPGHDVVGGAPDVRRGLQLPGDFASQRPESHV